MKLSDFIVSFFVEKGIKYIFGYVGGAITHLVDSIDKNKNLIYIQTYHEQTAAIAAEGYSRETGILGIAIATSGPGATNLITGIADAYFDSIPVIYITGQVNTYEFKYEKPIRQQGFQELDVISLVKSITKYAKLIDNPEDIRYELEKAFDIAKSERPGPVLLDIPMNVQSAEIDVDKLKKYEKNDNDKRISRMNEEAEICITNSKRPIILIGGAVKNLKEKLKQEFEGFLFNTRMPVVCSLMGKGAFQEDKVNFMGMIGSYGNRCANMSLANSDLLIAIGSRLDTRQTGANLELFMNTGKIIHIDIDENELEYHRIKNKINLKLDVNAFVEEFLRVTENITISSSWLVYLSKLKENYHQDQEVKSFVQNKSPYKLVQKLNEISKENDYFVADIGQNQMWSAQTLKIKKSQNFFTSGGLAPMGYSIPFAIGLSFGDKNKRIFSIMGDGGFHISTQGLMVISRYNLPIKIIVINNKSLGMITQFQSLYFHSNMVGTTEKGGYFVPDIEAIAKAYSLKYYKLREEDLSNFEIFGEIFGDNRTCVVEYLTDGLTMVSPKLEYDSPIYNPTPKLGEKELTEALKLSKLEI